MIWKLARPILFSLPAEPVHYLAMGTFSSSLKIPPVARVVRKLFSVSDPRLHVNVCGMQFSNPVGLAAGFDKEARWFNQLGCLGFSHVEVGTITGHGQPGNAKPRLFRLAADHALVNRMGFNNKGCDHVARRLAKSTGRRHPESILGINIGKTKIVDKRDAVHDYLRSFERLFSYADYVTVNVSSPNTPGLRELQDRDELMNLLPAISEKNAQLAEDHESKQLPIFLKISPDVNENQLDDFAYIAENTELSGVIATNTTISRDDLSTPVEEIDRVGDGGLSGRPLTSRSREIVRGLYSRIGTRIPIIGVGGIMNGHDAWQMIQAGASLIQIYTGFIYGGPAAAKQINRYLLEMLDKHGLKNISDAIGSSE